MNTMTNKGYSLLISQIGDMNLNAEHFEKKNYLKMKEIIKLFCYNIFDSFCFLGINGFTLHCVLHYLRRTVKLIELIS